MMTAPRRLPASAGIAIGPILFVIALLAILAMAVSSGNGDYQVASVADRVKADIVGQANMIRSAITQCNMDYSMAVSIGSVTTASETWPTSDSAGSAVSAVTCTPMGSTSLWSDKLLPPPTSGFNAWVYVNAGASGGRCIYAAPSSASPNVGILSGLANAANKFNTATAYSAASEVIYDPNSSSHKFIVWLTLPTGSPSSYCLP